MLHNISFFFHIYYWIHFTKCDILGVRYEKLTLENI